MAKSRTTAQALVADLTAGVQADLIQKLSPALMKLVQATAMLEKAVSAAAGPRRRRGRPAQEGRSPTPSWPAAQEGRPKANWRQKASP